MSFRGDESPGLALLSNEDVIVRASKEAPGRHTFVTEYAGSTSVMKNDAGLGLVMAIVDTLSPRTGDCSRYAVDFFRSRT